MGELLKLVLEYTWQFSAPLFVIILLVSATPYGKIHTNEATRKQWTGALIQSRGKSRYTRFMRKRLDWLDARLSTREQTNKKPPAQIAWSSGLIKLTMLLAVSYPILAFIIQWIAGSALRFGGTPLIPAGEISARIFVIFWLGLPAFIYLLSEKSKSHWRVPLYIVASVILFGGLFLSERFGVPLEIAGPVAFTFAFAGAVAFAGAFTFAGAVAGAVAFAGAFTFAFAVAFAGAVAFEFAGAFTFAVALSIEYLNNRLKSPFVQITFLALLLLLYTTVIMSFWRPANAPQAAYLFTFLAILPALNALADFASIGLTRYLLRKGLTGLTWYQALLDAFGGALIFFALGFTLITYFHYIQTPDGPLISIKGLFDDLETHPADMWWLAVMLGSTLIPTLLHLAIGVATFGLQAPKAVRKWIVDKLESGGRGVLTDGWQASLAICTMIVLSFWLPALGFYYILTANHSWVLKSIIALFKTYANFIGAL